MEAQVGQLYHWDENDHEGEEVEIEGCEESLVEPVDHCVEAMERHVLSDSIIGLGFLT